MQLGKNISRREREQTLGRNIAHLLGKVSSSDLSESDLSAITPALCRSGVGALAWRRLCDTPLADTAAGRQLHEVYRRFRLAALLHEREIVEVISALRAAGIEPVLVKGWAIARRYPDRALRPYGDIDLCVAPAQFPKAKHVLGSIANVSGPFVDLHSGFATIGVDTRRAWMRNIFSARSERPKRDDDWDELYARSQVVFLSEPGARAGSAGTLPAALPFAGNSFPVRILRDEDHLRLLCVHLLRSGARRPAWLCDVALLVEEVSRAGSAGLPAALPLAGSRQDTCAPRFDWSLCLGRNPVHAEWVGVAILLAHELLGADISETPFRDQQLPRWLVTETLRQWAEAVPSPKSKVQSPSSVTGHWTLDFGLWTSLYRRWDNPIRATAAVGGRFDERSRLGYRVAELLARVTEAPDHLRRLHDC